MYVEGFFGWPEIPIMMTTTTISEVVGGLRAFRPLIRRYDPVRAGFFFRAP